MAERWGPPSVDYRIILKIREVGFTRSTILLLGASTREEADSRSASLDPPQIFQIGDTVCFKSKRPPDGFWLRSLQGLAPAAVGGSCSFVCTTTSQSVSLAWNFCNILDRYRNSHPRVVTTIHEEARLSFSETLNYIHDATATMGKTSFWSPTKVGCSSGVSSQIERQIGSGSEDDIPKWEWRNLYSATSSLISRTHILSKGHARNFDPWRDLTMFGQYVFFGDYSETVKVIMVLFLVI
jgi:hypothetical protein